MFSKEKGFALVVSLILLFALSILVLSGSQSTLLQEKMTAAVRDSHVSLEVAESGVVDAEVVIEALADTSSFNSTGTGGKYSQDNGPEDYFDEAVWTDSTTAEATTSISDITAQYYIEYMGQLVLEADDSDITVSGYGESSESSDTHVFKIVSRSMGTDGNTERIIVSYYGKEF